ncbi:MAG: hypothetical protein MZW92_72650 [Comamonadaceae bacterium]|nr:hypothetical protein [Comamonadaceae bacterium]
MTVGRARLAAGPDEEIYIPRAARAPPPRRRNAARPDHGDLAGRLRRADIVRLQDTCVPRVAASRSPTARNVGSRPAPSLGTPGAPGSSFTVWP